MKLLMTMMLLLALAPAKAADAPWYAEFQSRQPAAPPGLPEDARETLREAIGSLMGAPAQTIPPPGTQESYDARKAREAENEAREKARKETFLRTIDRLSDLVPPGYQADEGRGVEEKLIVIARHKREHPELYEKILREILYNRARAELGQKSRGGPSAHFLVTKEMCDEDYRLVWEFFALTPVAPPPPPGTEPSQFFPLPGWQASAYSALEHYHADKRIIPTFMALFEAWLASGTRRGVGGQAISMFSQERPEFFVALLECQWMMDQSDKHKVEQPQGVEGGRPEAIPKPNLLEQRRRYLEKAARRDTRLNPNDKHWKPVPYEETDFAKWKAFVESVPRGSIPPKLLPYYDEHLKKLRETVIVPAQ